ncbi:hypothetical protein MTO96_042552, partial [Rhipicephalus appendiculatus]
MIVCDADFWILDDNLFPLVMSRLVGVAEEPLLHLHSELRLGEYLL